MAAPYPVSMTVYDTNGTTAYEGARVTAYNTTTGERLPASAEVLTASNGQAIIDLANFTSAYSNGDAIQIVVYVHKKSIEVRHIIDTSVGSYEPSDMILHWGGAYHANVKVISITVSNSDTTGKYVDFWDRDSPEAKRIPRVEIPNGATVPLYFGEEGLFFKGGICKELETRSANLLNITIKISKLPY